MGAMVGIGISNSGNDQPLSSHHVPLQRFDLHRIVHDNDSSIAAELNVPNSRYSFALIATDAIRRRHAWSNRALPGVNGSLPSRRIAARQSARCWRPPPWRAFRHRQFRHLDLSNREQQT
jgi:hypothetical protein